MQKQIFMLLAFTALGLTYMACEKSSTPVTPSTQDDLAAINSMRERAVPVFNRGDADAFMAFFTDDAVVMAPNFPPAIGKQAVRALFQGLFGQFAVEETLSSHEILLFGDWAFERGSYTATLTPRSGGGPIQDNGKIIFIWQRQSDGSWKIARDMWNTSVSLSGL